MKCMALINQVIGYWEYNMKLVVVKSNFSILLVPNYHVFRITVIYVRWRLYAASRDWSCAHIITIKLNIENDDIDKIS